MYRVRVACLRGSNRFSYMEGERGKDSCTGSVCCSVLVWLGFPLRPSLLLVGVSSTDEAVVHHTPVLLYYYSLT